MGAGAAANVVGGSMQAIAASMEQQAMFREFQNEINRQRGYQGQAWNIWQPAVANLGAEGAADAMGTGDLARLGLYGQVGNEALGQGASNNNEGFKRAQGALDLAGAARAKLGSYGDWMHGQGIAQERTGQDISKIGNFAQGTATVFPYRMYQAQHSMDELAFWGQMISSIGGGASNYASLFGGPQVGGSPGYATGGGEGSSLGGGSSNPVFNSEAVNPNYNGGTQIIPYY